jgi:hypothetical protein
VSGKYNFTTLFKTEIVEFAEFETDKRGKKFYGKQMESITC